MFVNFRLCVNQRDCKNRLTAVLLRVSSTQPRSRRRVEVERARQRIEEHGFQVPAKECAPFEAVCDARLGHEESTKLRLTSERNATAPLLQGWQGRGRSDSVADPRPATRDPRPRAKQTNRDPRPSANRAARPCPCHSAVKRLTLPVWQARGRISSVPLPVCKHMVSATVRQYKLLPSPTANPHGPARPGSVIARFSSSSTCQVLEPGMG